MATIRTTCPIGDHAVEVTSDAVVLRASEDAETLGTYSFVCTSCVDVVHRPASPRTVAALLAVGVDVVEPGVDDAEEEDGSGATHPDEALTPDDLLDLHLLLTGDTWLTALLDETG